MKQKFKLFLGEINSFLRLFLPSGSKEKMLFWGLLIFYLSYSLFIVFNTSITDNPNIETDLYFSFDNSLILKYGRTQVSGHPLMMIFYYPLVVLGNIIALVAGFKAKTVLFVTVSASMISMSCVYIYRYLVEIIEIKKRFHALLITFIYAFFSTNLILAFTSESFTLSAFFLSFSVYYYSYYIKNNTIPSFTSTAILSCLCLGGVTITNFAKGIVPVLFFKDTKLNIIKRILLLGLAFFAILLLLHISLSVFVSKDYFGSILNHKDSFTSGSLTGYEYLQRVFTHFFGAPLLFSEIISYEYLNADTGYYRNMIVESEYIHWLQYAFVWLIILLLALSVATNYKNRLFILVCFLFGVDLGIHCVFRFGLFMPFLYGGNWVYCIPLLLGWLYKSLKSDLHTNLFVGLLSCMLIGLIVNNLFAMVDFVSLAMNIYPAIH